MYKQTILLAFSFILTLISHGQNKDWHTFNKDNYSIEYPSNWELNESKRMGTIFILFSPSTSNKDQFRENINLIIQDLSDDNIDLKRYTEISENQIRTDIKNGKIIESKYMKDQDLEYHKIIYTGNQENRDLKFEQYYWVFEKKAYVLTLTCELSEFDNYKLTGEKILNSFKLRKK